MQANVSAKFFRGAPFVFPCLIAILRIDQEAVGAKKGERKGPSNVVTHISTQGRL